MCGICGVAWVDPTQPVDKDMLDRMTWILRHRGPDSRGLHVAAGIGLGVQRLSIVDLESGDQPIANEDGTISVVCNGEIYNSPELRRELEAAGHRFRTGSDVEAIVHLYEDLGPECVHRLRGMFGFALWDGRRRRLMLARDRLGIKPLSYAVTHEGLYFGSELKAILASHRVARDPDVTALDELFRFGFVIAPKTLFAGIRRLLPGHYLLYENGAVSMSTYWHPQFPGPDEPAPRVSADDWADCLRAKIEESVRIHLRSDVPVGAYLSAGIDSSSVVALAHRLSGRPIQTFTLSFTHASHDEVRTKRTLDQFPGHELPNQRIEVGPDAFQLYPRAMWHAEEPTVSGLEVPDLILSRGASRHVKVVLTGEGSDEILGGYPWFKWDRLLRPLTMLPLSIRRLMLLRPFLPNWQPRGSHVFLAPRETSFQWYRRLIGPVFAEQRHQLFAGGLEEQLTRVAPLDGQSFAGDGRGWAPFTQLQYHELTVRLPNFVTHLLDRASMASGVEARVPLLDHELVELCARIPPRLKLRGLREKYILRHAMRGVVPREIAQRTKRGLAAPYRHWLREPLPPFAEDLLSEERLREKGYFVPAAVRTLLARHCGERNRRNEATLLMAVLGIQMWDELFVRGRGAVEFA